MPRVKKLNLLSDELEEQLVQRIKDNGFGGYKEHAEWLEENGVEVSSVCVWHYGNELKRQIERKEQIADLVKSLSRGDGDDYNEIGKALVEIAGAKVLELLLQFDVSSIQDVTFKDVVDCIDKLNRSKLAVQSYQMRVQKRTIKVLDNLEPELRGLSPERAAAIRAQILGIPD
jgi:hypothetical protein